ncbi:MAG: tetratricopeptide repeat protein [Planctomycetota bacterium]
MTANPHSFLRNISLVILGLVIAVNAILWGQIPTLGLAISAAVVIVCLFFTSGVSGRRYSRLTAPFAVRPEERTRAKELREQIQADPKNHEAIAEIARLFTSHNRIGEAAAAWEQAARAAPDNLEYCAQNAKMLLRRGKFAEARKEAEAIREKDPDNDDAVGVLASAALLTGDMAKARSLAEMQIRKEPQSYAALNALGNIAIAESRDRDGKTDMDKLKEAMERFLLASAVKKIPHEALFNLGYTYNLIGQKKLALDYIKQAIDIEPRNIVYIRAREELASYPFEKFLIAVFSALFMGAVGWTIYEAGRFFWHTTPTIQAVMLVAAVVLVILIISARRKRKAAGKNA